MKPLAECLDLIQGKSPDEFVREQPHPVLICLGVIAGELQRNPTKAAGTMFLSLSGAPDSGDQGPLVNQVFSIQKVSRECPVDGIYIGATTDNDIVIPDSSISKSHTHIVLGPEGCFLVDHGSTNGTFINGARIDPQGPTLLKGGDILTLGRFSFTYYDAMSFAKLLFVQAMARGRSRPSVRTPGSARASVAGSSGLQRAVPPPGNRMVTSPTDGGAPPAPAPWATSNPNLTPAAGGPPREISGTGWQPNPPGLTPEWQQRAVGKIPPGGIGSTDTPVTPGTHPSRQVGPAAVAVQAEPVPTSWVARLMLRLSNWLRRMAGS